MKNWFVLGGFVLGLVVLVLSTPAGYGDTTTKPSPQVSALLAEAKTEAVQLRRDAEELKTFTRSNLSWQSHSAKINEIKNHVNNSGQLLTKLKNAQAGGSSQQQQTIERIEPLLKDLAASVESTIEHLSQHSMRLRTAPYRAYVDANADIAGELADVISQSVEYEKTRAKSEDLAEKLESSGN